MITISLENKKKNSVQFTVTEICEDVKIPNYQRNSVWTLEQSRTFIHDVLFRGASIPRMMLLCPKRTPGCDPKPENCFLLDGLQRRLALSDFLEGKMSIQYEGREITKNNISNLKKLQGYKIICDYIDGKDREGVMWIDNEQKRVSHTPGDYIYRHRHYSGIAKMTHDVFEACKIRLNQYLDRNTLYGNYIIDRNEDFYPFLALIIAREKGANVGKRDIPTCWPDRENTLWLDRLDITSIHYDNLLVNTLIGKINSIQEKYTIQSLVDIILTEASSKSVQTRPCSTCRAIIKTGQRKGVECGKPTRYTGPHGRKCCGNHQGKTTEFAT